MAIIKYSVLFVIFLFVTLPSVSSDCGTGDPPYVAPEHNGQPGCQTRYEFTRLWRNNYMKDYYWKCEAWNEPADSKMCPKGAYFQDAWQICLPFNQWQWTPFSEPPSRPFSVLGENCQEINLPDECPSIPPPPDTNGNSTDSPPSTTSNGTLTTYITTTPKTTTVKTTTPKTTTTKTTKPPKTTTAKTTKPPKTTTAKTTKPPKTTTAKTTKPPKTTTTPMTTSEPIGICPGAKDHQYAPGVSDCLPPVCTEGKWEENIHYPTRDPQAFYQCHSPDILKVMPCAPGTCFDFYEQVCVHYADWVNNCN